MALSKSSVADDMEKRPARGSTVAHYRRFQRPGCSGTARVFPETCGSEEAKGKWGRAPVGYERAVEAPLRFLKPDSSQHLATHLAILAQSAKSAPPQASAAALPAGNRWRMKLVDYLVAVCAWGRSSGASSIPGRGYSSKYPDRLTPNGPSSAILSAIHHSVTG